MLVSQSVNYVGDLVTLSLALWLCVRNLPG